jgi:glycine/D-amino acid oxidase-like deaminating enzyme
VSQCSPGHSEGRRSDPLRVGSVTQYESYATAEPDNDRIIIASTYSGHGLKHSAAIGEALVEQVIDGKSKIDMSSFSMTRFKDLIQ